MQERESSKPTSSEDVLGCSTSARTRFKPQISTDTNQLLRCPRCDSSNTKFCYYNNYSLLQPRYFCKSCRRYWTKGGSLRNVPIGGGCRKNKRISRQRITSSEIPVPTTNHMINSQLDPNCTTSFSFDPATGAALSPTNPSLRPSLSLMQPSDSTAASLFYFNLPTDGGNPSQQLMMRPPSSTDRQQSSGLFSRQLASYLPSAMASQYLSNVGGHPLHNVGFNASADNDYLAANLAANSAGEQLINSSYIQENPNVTADQQHNHHHHHQHHHQNEHFWIKSPHERNLFADQKNNHNIAAPMENQAIEGPMYTQLRPNLSPKVEEGWQAHGQAEASTAADQAANYWNNGGWSDIAGYNPAADHPFM